MKYGRAWLEHIAEQTRLSEENISRQPIVELCGSSRLIIENHCSITKYTRELICIEVSYGTLRIEGNCLLLGRISKQQLLIRGRISCITLVRR